MRTVNLSSGSRGNCTYIESNLAKVMIDEGLSLMSIEERLGQIDVSGDEIDAILLTHEHVDHIGGIKYFLKKHRNVKIYIPSYVQHYGIKKVDELPDGQIVWFNTSEFFIKDIKVTAFILPHDSKFCLGYSLQFAGKKVSYATDLGYVSPDTLKELWSSDILFIESNHDETMLKNNPQYPTALKKRILSNNGHLSNVACATALSSLVSTGVRQAVLCHLSEENNSPALAYNTVRDFLYKNGAIEGKHIFIDVAYQHKIGTIFNL